MPLGKDYVSFILDNTNEIKNFIAEISGEMSDYIDSKPNSRFILFYKYLTHSDLATFGKATHVNSLDKNLLYYIDENDMRNIEQQTSKPFQTAHQSCIGLKEKLYTMVGLPLPRQTDPYLINDHMNVYLCNSNMQYFTSKYTSQIFNTLNKKVNGKQWDFSNLDIELSNDKFTSISLHCAVHGLGMAQDTDFHKLRHHLFKGDTFILLFELASNEKNMFVLLEKNPAFFSIINETNKNYQNYQESLRKKLIQKTIAKKNAVEQSSIDDEITRQQQGAWRKMLAKEMMGYTQVDGQVFCPFTYLTANFNELGALFIASHIKGFSDVNTTNEEKYDVNNGILLSANADALFDKHLISINQNKELVFSFLLDNDQRLKQQLLLLQPIFQPILNVKRMEYLQYHYNYFKQLENQRKRA